MNTNLFENAQFGDEFIRRDGKTARYCGKSNRSYSFILEYNGELYDVNKEGFVHSINIPNDKDIIIKKDDEKTKVIYISLPISGQEDTYNERLAENMLWCKTMFPNADIITPKDIADKLDAAQKELAETEGYPPLSYEDYLLSDLHVIIKETDTILMCEGWMTSRGCSIEHVVAKLFNKRIFYK